MHHVDLRGELLQPSGVADIAQRRRSPERQVVPRGSRLEDPVCQRALRGTGDTDVETVLDAGDGELLDASSGTARRWLGDQEHAQGLSWHFDAGYE